MVQTLNSKLIAGAALLGTMAFAADTADAALMLKLESGGSILEATDQLAGDEDATHGVVAISGPLDSFFINYDVGLDGSSLADPGVLHLTSLAAGTGTLTVSLTLTDLVGPIDDLESLFEVGGVAGGTVEVTGYVDTSNTEFGTATPLGTASGIDGAFSDSFTPIVGVDELYSVTIVAVITHDELDTTSFDAEISIVPEPGSLALLGLGGLLAARRRRG